MELRALTKNLDGLVLFGLAVTIAATCIRSYRPYTFIFRDGSFYAQTNRSIANGFTLRQEEFQPKSWYDGSLPWYRNLDVAWSNVSVGKNGEWYPKHSFIMPLFSTPFYLILGLDGLLVFNALCMLLALFSGYRLASRITSKEAAAVAVFTLATSPLVPYLTYAYSNDVFYTALLILGLEALLHKSLTCAGLLQGLSIAVKPTCLIAVLPLSVALLRKDFRALARVYLFAGVPVALQALANACMYGSPFATSYHRVLTVVNGQQVVASNVLFDYPLVQGMKRFFISSPEGEVWQMASLGVLAYIGLLALLRRNLSIALALLVSVVGFFFVFAKYRYGGARFFMPWFVLSLLPASAFVQTTTELLSNKVFAIFKRKITMLTLSILCVLAVLISWTSRFRVPSSLATSVERLKVSLDSIPCDYFNLTHQKWECSGLEPSGKKMVGLALPGECPETGQPMLYIPAHSSKTRTVAWEPQVFGNRLSFVWTWNGESPPSWTITVNSGEPISPEMVGRGNIGKFDIKGPVGPGSLVKITLPSRPGEVFLCIEGEVVE